MPNGGDTPAERLAVAVNDITWMKQAMTDTSEGVKSLQRTLDEHIKSQDEKYARKDDFEALKREVNKISTWQKKVTGAGLLIMFAVEAFGHKLHWW